ncbi:AraC family transcriptional regulator [soil metagenome]
MSADGLAATPRTGGRLADIQLYGGLFAGAVGAFCLAQWMGHGLGLASDIIAIAGDATCGWSWLLVRALFQPAGARRTAWSLALVLVLVASGAFLRLAGESPATLPRMIDNLSGLISSALLLLAMVEPLRGLASEAPAGERRFRLVFAAGYAALLVIAVVWVNGAPAGGVAAQGKMAIKSTCALLALLGMALAIWYRHGHPLTEISRGRRRVQTIESGGFAERLQRLMSEETVYTRHSLKVADLARRLGEPDYKVTQCITGPLGFRNFNQMANHFRIEEAKRQLADSAYDHLPILTIAFDCGFGSVGPFNRAFKATTGLTPQQFRRAC